MEAGRESRVVRLIMLAEWSEAEAGDNLRATPPALVEITRPQLV